MKRAKTIVIRIPLALNGKSRDEVLSEMHEKRREKFDLLSEEEKNIYILSKQKRFPNPPTREECEVMSKMLCDADVYYNLKEGVDYVFKNGQWDKMPVLNRLTREPVQDGVSESKEVTMERFLEMGHDENQFSTDRMFSITGEKLEK